MDIVVHATEETTELGEAFACGARIFADKCSVCVNEMQAVSNSHVAILVGRSEASSTLSAEYRSAGARLVFLDDGYTDARKYHKASVDHYSPIRYVGELQATDDRFARAGMQMLPTKRGGNHIVLVGMDDRYCEDEKLGTSEGHAQWVVDRIHERTDRQVIYRPPHGAVHSTVVRAALSRRSRSVRHDLNNAHALVTHGSDEAIDALQCGVPVFMLGDHPARIVGRSDLAFIEEPFMPEDDERYQFLCNLAYCQWTLSEFRSGQAWETISEQLERY